jgi:drug/metabolite transporter (DMT)-like permease
MMERPLKLLCPKVGKLYLYCSAQVAHFCNVSTKTKAYLAYAYVAIIWGTTYFAIRVAVLHYPPFLMAGVRQIISFFIIAAIALSMNKSVNFSKQNLIRNAIIGFLMITVGNGVVSAAERVIPSGVASLVCSMMPISVVVLNLLFSKSERPTWVISLGMFLGFSGVALIFRNDLAALRDPRYLIGIFATLIATFGWGGGSILSKRWGNPVNPMMDAGVQVGFGGIFLLVFSPLVDNYEVADWYDTNALWALIYLIIFGSVIAFTAYRYALKHLPVGLVTSYAYINPLVAVLIGFFAGELVTGWTILSFIAIIAGVAIVNTGYQRRRKMKEADLALKTITITE